MHGFTSRRSWTYWALPALLWMAGSNVAHGHSVRLEADELLRLSHRVAVGRVVSQQASWNETGTMIVTDYEIAVEETLRGALAATVQFRMIGGELDGETHDSCLTSHFQNGQRYVFFFSDPLSGGLNPLVGAEQGFVAEHGTENGVAVVARGQSPILDTLAGDGALDFDKFVGRLRESLATVAFEPAPPKSDQRRHRPKLPAKRFVPHVSGSTGSFVLPKPDAATIPDGDRRTPAPPSDPTIDPAFVVEEHERQALGLRYYFARSPSPYIVFDPLPLDWSWSPFDQNLMARWNFYGDVFRVTTTPSSTWAWGNNRYELAGWPDDPTMQAQFGQSWGATDLAVTFSRWYGSGPIIESDIALNPGWSWTLDNEYATRGEGYPESFEQTMLHELGHAWGLQHPWEYQDVWWDSVMNYAPQAYRFPWPTADDANAIRDAYPGMSRHDAMLSFFTTTDGAGSNMPRYDGARIMPAQIHQGSSFSLTDSVKIENLGTTSIVGPQIEVYLTPRRMSWSGPRYLTTKSSSSTLGVFTTLHFNLGSIYVPTSTPPGTYYVGLFRRDHQDEKTGNDSAWSAWGDTLTVLSWRWRLLLDSFGGSRSEELGPDGTFIFHFDATPGKTYVFSLCSEDGGSADFDTVLELVGSSGQPLAVNDDACGLQSKIVYTAEAAESVDLRVRGYSSENHGNFFLHYRSIADDSLVYLEIGRDSATGQTRLDWSGGTPPYDVERATKPDFSDGTVVQRQTSLSYWIDEYQDPSNEYYYRVR